MNVATRLEQRRREWNELERRCDQLELRGRAKDDAAGISRFASLYRSACADLALASAYQLPPATIGYLHRLVARAHNQLYRGRRFHAGGLLNLIMHQAPQQIFADPCVRVATIIFFGLFSLSMALGASSEAFPDFPAQIVGAEQLETLESMYAEPIEGSLEHYMVMSAFYIKHNTGIGLQCFAYGILIIPAVFVLSYNAVVLGTSFGYMAREGIEGGDNFFHFVTAHGPFELTAIALSAAAGLRLGLGLFSTEGLRRSDSLRRSAHRAVPIIAAAVILFVLAALTEGFLSPSPLPYVIKAGWAILSSGMLMFYFVVLGFPRDLPVETPDAT